MKTFAYFDTGHEFPEEIVMAAGLAPYKVLGDADAGTGPADEFLFSFLCPFSRSCLTEALTHAGNWAGIGFAHGCDATNRQFDVWKVHVDAPFLHWVNTPMKIDGSSHAFYVGELMRFIRALEAHYDVDISAQKLQEAISLSNAIKARMKQLAALRTVRDIPNTDYLDMVKTAIQSPKAAVLENLTALAADWESRTAFPDGKVPVLLTGSDVTTSGWMETLEEADLRVVRDDLSLGERYFSCRIPDRDDPVTALVDYNFSIPQPATRVPSDNRMDNLLRILAETPVAGVVSQNLKFCEPYAHDAVWIVPAVREKGHKVIHVEREYTPKVDQQLLTRLETFKELL